MERTWIETAVSWHAQEAGCRSTGRDRWSDGVRFIALDFGRTYEPPVD
jgi:hypothetical protein